MQLVGTDVSTGRTVEIAFGRVIEGVDEPLRPPEDAPIIAPGFIDLQVNGYSGCDYNSPDAPQEAIAQSLAAQFATGVTRLFPTVITGPPEQMAACLRNLAEARERLPAGRAMEGFHVEGPHISPEDGPRGAHPREWVRPPDIEEYRRWQEAARGHVRLVTVAPEWPEAPGYIESLVADGVVVSIGHTRTTTRQLAEAVRAGATMSTHLGNAGDPFPPKHPNYLWDQLAEDRLAAGFIVDGHHLAPSFLRVALRAKGADRSILVTDAVMPTGCAPGRYRIGAVEVEMHADDRVTLTSEERLAGSVLRMDRAIGNLMALTGLPLSHALAMATRNPARVGRIASRQRGLVPGDRADIVELRINEGTLEIQRTWLDGELVYSS